MAAGYRIAHTAQPGQGEGNAVIMEKNEYICNLKFKAMKLGTTEIILILAVVLLLFGGKKIPELMKGLGKGMKEFKDASNGVDNSETEKK